MPLAVLRPKNVSRRAKALSMKSSILVHSHSSKFINGVGTLLHQKPTKEISVAERSVEDLRQIPRFYEPLKYNHDEEMMREERREPPQLSASSAISEGDECPTEALGTAQWFNEITAIEKAPRSSQRFSPRTSPKRQVTFEESVVVVPVPLRSDYSERLRNKLWTNAVEVCDNVGKRLCTHSNRNTKFRSTPSNSDQFYSSLHRAEPDRVCRWERRLAMCLPRRWNVHLQRHQRTYPPRTRRNKAVWNCFRRKRRLPTTTCDVVKCDKYAERLFHKCLWLFIRETFFRADVTTQTICRDVKLLCSLFHPIDHHFFC